MTSNPETEIETENNTEVDKPVNSIEDAKKSAPDDKWDETVGDNEDEDAETQEELDAAATRLYRGVAARLNYISPDRPDIAFAVKEAARNMQKPTMSDLKKLRKIGKYLIGCPRLVAEFRYQNEPNVGFHLANSCSRPSVRYVPSMRRTSRRRAYA